MLGTHTRLAAAVAVVSILNPAAFAAKKKKKGEEEITQTLEVLPDPPFAVKADASRLVFHTSPLTSKGLLSQQVRDSIKALWRANQGATIVKIRALVAGTGDLRRVSAIVSEMFTEKRLPLPAVSTIQVGGLGTVGAQVVLEATSVAKRPANPDGLVFVSGKGASSKITPETPTAAMTPLAVKSMTDLRTALEAVQSTSADVRRVTCFLSSLDDLADVQRLFYREFPQAVFTYAQTQRSPASHVVECEATAKLNANPGVKWKVVNPPTLRSSPAYSQLAVAGPGPLLLTGTQLAFRTQESDVRLAFDRLKAALEQHGTSTKNVFWSGIYSLSQTATDRIRAVRMDYYDKAAPPASTLMQFEGLPSLDASFAVEVIAGIP